MDEKCSLYVGIEKMLYHVGLDNLFKVQYYISISGQEL